ncbi:hypothetical protein QTQ03_09440 [Micromonospora sp. WMMA1363]|nr:hypothetical protein [Micromonospora sp. WMMA1363]MDM4719788.1 hypothetical protein [Micromonospora sp. WMMA1363]
MAVRLAADDTRDLVPIGHPGARPEPVIRLPHDQRHRFTHDAVVLDAEQVRLGGAEVAPAAGGRTSRLARLWLQLGAGDGPLRPAVASRPDQDSPVDAVRAEESEARSASNRLLHRSPHLGRPVLVVSTEHDPLVTTRIESAGVQVEDGGIGNVVARAFQPLNGVDIVLDVGGHAVVGLDSSEGFDPSPSVSV